MDLLGISEKPHIEKDFEQKLVPKITESIYTSS